jgi:hypothetical protein
VRDRGFRFRHDGDGAIHRRDKQQINERSIAIL